MRSARDHSILCPSAPQGNLKAEEKIQRRISLITVEHRTPKTLRRALKFVPPVAFRVLDAVHKVCEERCFRYRDVGKNLWIHVRIRAGPTTEKDCTLDFLLDKLGPRKSREYRVDQVYSHCQRP